MEHCVKGRKSVTFELALRCVAFWLNRAIFELGGREAHALALACACLVTEVEQMGAQDVPRQDLASLRENHRKSLEPALALSLALAIGSDLKKNQRQRLFNFMVNCFARSVGSGKRKSARE